MIDLQRVVLWSALLCSTGMGAGGSAGRRRAVGELGPRVALLLLLATILSCSGETPPVTLERPWPIELPENAEDGSHFDPTAKQFYEGWYHKISLPQRGESFFFIYAVTNPKPIPATPSEAYLYCGRASTLETVYQSFAAEAYSAAKGYRDVTIGRGSRATALRFAGDAVEGNSRCSWDIELDEGVAWNKTMGWLTGHRGLETSWTVGTIRAKASGRIRFNGELFEFDDGIGYCDHNWGTTFPEKWVWLQANSFANPSIAMAASGGSVPLSDKAIEAFMIGLLHGGKISTFRSQDLDRITSSVTKKHWRLIGSRELERITIDGRTRPGNLFLLRVPAANGMQPRAWESLLGTLSVTVETRQRIEDDWEVTFEDVSNLAGLEIGE